MLSGLSYNIQLGKNLLKIVDWLGRFPRQFNIICFQEFPSSQIKLFQSQSSYVTQFAASFRKKGEIYGELTLVLKKNVKVLSVQTIDLGKSIYEQRMSQTTGTRSSLVTKLLYNDVTFVLANTHLAAIASNMHRRKQVRKLIEYLGSSLFAQQTPMIILGDFNYSSLFGRKGLIKLMHEQQYTNAYLEDTHKLLNIKDHQLDYIFYKNIQVKHSKVLNLSFSDHRPITFALELLNENK